MKNKLIQAISLLILIGIFVYIVFAKDVQFIEKNNTDILATENIISNKKSEVSINTCQDDQISKELDSFDFEQGNEVAKEYSLPGVPSEGSYIKYFKLNNSNSILEVYSFGAAARFFTKYYIDDSKVFYVISITQEWDLEKLHGKNAELEFGQGEFVVKTSTREEYIVKDNVLCKYIAMKPREKSAATTASNPTEDLDSLLNIYNKLTTKLNF